MRNSIHLLPKPESVRAITWSTRNALLQTGLLCVCGKGSGCVEKAATSAQPLLCALLPKQGKYPTTWTTKRLHRKETKGWKGTEERQFLTLFLDDQVD